MEERLSIVRGTLGEGRLDKALAEAVPTLSRERAKKLIAGGHLEIAGKSVTSLTDRGHAGADFTLSIPAPAPAEAQPEEIALDIVYEDDALIVVNKPAGLVVHPAAGHRGGTLVNALLHHCAGELSGIGGVARPGIVHRIDKDTSGLIVAAKTDAAHEGLAAQFKAHSIERRYLAIASGRPNPGEGRIETHIARSPSNRKKMAVCGAPRGKRAVTHYRIEAMLNHAALVECRLETGRTHQVRVHMAHIGHPLIGDPLYARRKNGPESGPVRRSFPRQALHAARLGFIHPITDKYLEFSRDLPADMQELLSELRVL